MKSKNTPKKKSFLNNKKVQIGVVLLGVVLLAALVANAVLADRVSTALNSRARAYNNVTVTIQQTMIDLVLAGQASENGEESIPAELYTTTVQKDGSSYYEVSDTTACYFYQQDGEAYVLYYDDQMEISQGQWVQAPVKDTNWKPAFDFSVLDKLEAAMFEKIDGHYVPVDMDQVFFAFFSTGDRSYYKSRDISFEISAGKLKTITVHYIFNAKYQITEVYSFEYGNAAVTVPNIDTEGGT